jgi:hypothetical protein
MAASTMEEEREVAWSRQVGLRKEGLMERGQESSMT